jgi:NitT/TauT family transport system ATP-binding protein
MLTSTEYQQCKQEALELLHEEAIKSFAAGAVNAADFLEAYAHMGQDQAPASKDEHAAEHEGAAVH